YFLATLASVAKVDAMRIKQSVVELGDGTYAVQFNKGSTKTFVRVDGDLATYSWGGMAYADAGAQGSLWVAGMEKAFAFFRRTTGTYAARGAGWMREGYRGLGKTSTASYQSNGTEWLVSTIKTDLTAGKSVTYAASNPNDGAPLIGSHAYTVDSVVTDTSGTV